MARPSKFTPDLAEMAVFMARNGEPMAFIAEYHGVSRRTLCAWLRRGRAGELPFAEWAADFDAAKEHARVVRVRLYWQRETVRRTVSWQKFKLARVQWWRDQLGEKEFRRRREEWIAARALRRKRRKRRKFSIGAL